MSKYNWISLTVSKFKEFLGRARFCAFPSNIKALEWDKMTTTEKGCYGEQLALAYCQKELGFKLITRNWYDQAREIDLICTDRGVLVFVEVRLRSKEAKISGLESINNKKKSALRRAALAYLKRLYPRPHTYRFDVVSIAYGSSDDYQIMHYRNVALF